MAKNDISSIVFKAVVDTSGVAAGLNNIGAQVAGRQFGTGGGGPTGASGAAGGFVNPHGGSAPGSVAATAAAAAFGLMPRDSTAAVALFSAGATAGACTGRSRMAIVTPSSASPAVPAATSRQTGNRRLAGAW